MLRHKTFTMKRLLVAILMLSGLAVHAQYNNEWIDYNKTYFKFPVGKTRLYRIPQASLQTIGLGSTPVEQFQLWRNGKEVPLFTSVVSGPMGGTDYIEFWGVMNDGKSDKNLYRDPAFQLSDKWSLETDTAAFFLTVNPLGGNLRVSDDVNNVAGNILAPETYFMYTLGMYFKNKINPGFAAVVGEYVYSSSYDIGEGYSSDDIYPSAPKTINHTNLYPYTSGPGASFSIAGSGNALNSRTLKAKINNSVLVDQQMDFFNDLKYQVPVPMALINSGNVSVELSNTSANPNDRLVVAKYELSYPRLFNFGGTTNFEFDLPSSASGNYLEITNFNYGSTAPVLYDLTNLKRYAGDLLVPGKIRFAIPASIQSRHLVLVNEEASNINVINSFNVRNFVNYATPANQGDYLIISNPLLYSGPDGNLVDAYRLYRSSSAGGGFNAKVYDIDQLVDQFGLGIKKHPLSIKNYLRYARNVYATLPKFVLIIGKGVTYDLYRNNESDPNSALLDLVPTFGFPGSDNLLAANDGETVPATPIGRLSVIRSSEINQYLTKLKEYESNLTNTPQTIGAKSWMKNIVHAIGGSDTYLQAVLYGYMNAYKAIIEDTLYGGNVRSFSKNSAFNGEQLTSAELQSLFAEGIGIITYFGHSSASTLEFNLDEPSLYDNPGKYPLFFVNGCLAGNIFTYDPFRLTNTQALSEKYVLANERGGIAFIASTHFGIVNYLNIFMDGVYTAISKTKYGRPLGEVLAESVRQLLNLTGSNDYYGRLLAEEMALNGDPALQLPVHSNKADYAIEDPQVRLSPNLISVSDNNFSLFVKFYNLGMAVSDSIVLDIKRQLPDGSINTFFREKIPGVNYVDSIQFSIPINPIVDKGENKFIVTIDADNAVDEISESNNSITKDFHIIEDEITPIYPYNYSIINKNSINFFASTANPLSKVKNYVMEIDTTAAFNSSSKKTINESSVGGVIEFKPNINFDDSTVYYWRTALVPSDNNYVWNTSSFLYHSQDSAGFNQSHYYQHVQDQFQSILLNSDRSFYFEKESRMISAKMGLYPYFKDADITISRDQDRIASWMCEFNELQIVVFDSLTAKPWVNYNPIPTQGRFGSRPICFLPPSAFSFLMQDSSQRRHAMQMLDSIPDGDFVMIYWTGVATDQSFVLANKAFVKDWKADTVNLGPNRSLYHKMISLGLTDIDSFTRNVPFLFFFKKNRPNYPIYQHVGAKPDEYINTKFFLDESLQRGAVESPWFGPAIQWKDLHWDGKNIEPEPDSAYIQIYGKDLSGNESLLSTIQSAHDTSIGFIDAKQYPYLKLKMYTSDTIHCTPNQLLFWRLIADLPPEGALAPNIYFISKDTLEVGEKLHFSIAFKNVSPKAFDSMQIKMILTDHANVSHTILLPKGKPLISGDTLTIEYFIDTKDYPGNNTIFLDVNPDNSQPEQYHFNNFLYQSFYVKPDNFNPLLDVTFDGVHILKDDIVSAKPNIVIKLKDDSRFLALDDSSLMTVQLRYPDGTLRAFSFNNDTLRFIPSNLVAGGSDNTATIEFNPRLLQDGDYELIVTGKDKSGNKAGNLEYRTTFKVINKPMISNLLNYPNPFTTSTAFVFTVTGIDVPQNIKIEIMTITGKIVREITKSELGPIHVGRNITEFKWDGTDQYSQKLANGVYLYRVVTNLNGKSLDKYKSADDNTDRYFTNGYGKMYLMR
jgi:hypothetical protein